MTSEPQTESRARRDHEEAWATDATEWHMNHRSDPDDCPGCDALNEMLSEAASKAVAEVLDRLEKYNAGTDAGIVSFIASERER